MSGWVVIPGVPDRVNIHCLNNDTCLCHVDVKITNNSHGFKKGKCKTFNDVETGV